MTIPEKLVFCATLGLSLGGLTASMLVPCEEQVFYLSMGLAAWVVAFAELELIRRSR